MNRHALYADYVAAHRTPGNKLTHAFGIPMIVVATTGLTRLIPFSLPLAGVNVDISLMLTAAVSLWALWFARLAAVPFCLILALVYVGSAMIPPAVLIALFGAGWALQLVGHAKFEKKRPSFTKNLVHLLVGPIFVYFALIGRRSL